MLLALLLTAAAPLQAAPAAPSQATSAPIRNFATAPGAFAPTSVVGDYYDVLLRLPDGHEHFALYTPPNPAPNAALLVHFHAHGFNHWDLPAFAPQWLDEAASRGWYAIAVTQVVPGSTTTTYGNEEAQRRVEGVLDWTLEHFPAIDQDRIYAYGFSMGGGDVLSYGAQHLDSTKPMFAAIATNGPTVGLIKEYVANGASNPSMMTAMGGVSPQANMFPYWAASTLLYDLQGNLLPGKHPLDNIRDTPLWLWRSTNEPPSIQAQCDDLDFLMTGVASYNATIVNGNHNWQTFDVAQVCNWFASQSLQIPIRGDLVVARDARYYDLTVHRRNQQELGEIEFDLQAPGFGTRRLDFGGIQNLNLVEVDGAAHGLGMISPDLDIDVERASDEFFLRITDWPQLPGAVFLDGVQVASGPTTWGWNGSSLTLRTPSASAPGPSLSRWRLR